MSFLSSLFKPDAPPPPPAPPTLANAAVADAQASARAAAAQAGGLGFADTIKTSSQGAKPNPVSSKALLGDSE